MLAVTPETSPPKWHLAHTTWFFEKFVLEFASPDRAPYDPGYAYLFNSYYETLEGGFLPKEKRNSVSRPSLDEILTYRRAIDEEIFHLLTSSSEDRLEALLPRVELGLHHEQQHQELFVMDVKRNFYENPTPRTYPLSPAKSHLHVAGAETKWITFPEGITAIGAFPKDDFCYDNERGLHRVWLESFELASAPVTQGEYAEFIEDGGYSNPRWWLSDGWKIIRKENWEVPLYWERDPLVSNAPVSHLSYYEAQAYAKWKGCRLPTEQEWERAAASVPVVGHFLEEQQFQAKPIVKSGHLQAMHGTLWEWTQSAYLPYPRYREEEGALGEYNGKFMCGTFVLRGGSFATPVSHYRPTYRNFYAPESRWQFAGLRLARDPS